ncbi:MAG: DUF167 domain-containing protein [Candidatus Pacebacteria bacterium]|nr:DUF167 domain-containing protein [Candidatus Paceibacterota bacterium]
MYIKVKVKTEAKKESFEKSKKDDEFLISVKEEARNGWANERILEILKKELKTNNVRLVSGHTSPSKIFSID